MLSDPTGLFSFAAPVGFDNPPAPRGTEENPSGGKLTEAEQRAARARAVAEYEKTEGAESRPPPGAPADPAYKTDIERFHERTTPGLPFLFGPAHLGPYLRDPAEGIEHPVLRFHANLGRSAALGAARGALLGGAAEVSVFTAGTLTATVVTALAPEAYAAASAAARELSIGLYLSAPRLAEAAITIGAWASGTPRPSVWDLDPISRGRVLHTMFGENLPRNFPTIDKVEGMLGGVSTSITSIKTLDVTRPTYAAAGALTNLVGGFVDKVAAFTSARVSDVAVRAGPATKRGVELVLEAGAASKEQLKELADAAVAAAARGVTLVVHFVR